MSLRLHFKLSWILGLQNNNVQLWCVILLHPEFLRDWEHPLPFRLHHHRYYQLVSISISKRLSKSTGITAAITYKFLSKSTRTLLSFRLLSADPPSLSLSIEPVVKSQRLSFNDFVDTSCTMTQIVQHYCCGTQISCRRSLIHYL